MVVIVFIIISDHLVIALADIALLKVREMGLGGVGGVGGDPNRNLWLFVDSDTSTGRLEPWEINGGGNKTKRNVTCLVTGNLFWHLQ